MYKHYQEHLCARAYLWPCQAAELIAWQQLAVEHLRQRTVLHPLQESAFAFLSIAAERETDGLQCPVQGTADSHAIYTRLADGLDLAPGYAMKALSKMHRQGCSQVSCA